MTLTTLPELDISGFLADETSPQATEFISALRNVIHEVGFFYLTGHGVSSKLTDEILKVTDDFFALDEEQRLEIENVRSPQFRGYTRFGHELTNGKVDLRDQVDISRELDPRVVAPHEPQWLRLRGPNLWPSSLPSFRDASLRWIDALESVAHSLLRAMSLALGQPADIFESSVTPAEVLLKIIRYVTPQLDPDQSGSVANEFGASLSERQGVGAHRDTGFITFVLQGDVGGLQVEYDGVFRDVAPRRDAFVVNIGEMLQLVTQGYFKATVHRVQSPPPGTERKSVAFFFNPKLETTLTPLRLPAEIAAQAPGGASADPNNPILANYGDNSLKVRLRAHPDVAQRHHADLLASGVWTH